MTVRAGRRRVRPELLVATGAVSVQSGAAVATHLFARVGPAGAVTLRLVLGAVVLLAAVRPSPRSRRGRDLAAVALFGVALGAMNLAFYESIARIPLGVAVTVEFVGPLAVAVAGSRRLRDLLWAALAGAGVALLAASPGGRLDPVGIVLALVAGGCWAGYILLSREAGRRMEGVDGLALAMVVAAVIVAPGGLVAGGTRLVHPSTLGLGLAVAVLSSVLPYSLELVALRSVSPRAFGVLLSLDPAVAALAGLVVLGQHLGGHEVVAVVLVISANVGSSIASARRPDVALDA
ncbi:EamA family transporter [Acidiferrimicrobium sp. IK]|uniref:EamA family transporter n=1 Tax=Acidiferrimicrobium sp. IK TaxID=2871700 RepID=UPI0021CB6393|nr:EamA family transporter [Acidiferrimicrobium sp. IK]MCU4184352.1 EamA family transporter [Acidiferrimicrobium sp. IK]